MSVDLTKVKVGEKYVVARCGNWRVHTEGTYVVAKADKIKIVLKRESDGYERTWSVKKGQENPKRKGGYVARDTWLETLEDAIARALVEEHTRNINYAWKNLETAAQNKNLNDAENVMSELRALLAKKE